MATNGTAARLAGALAKNPSSAGLRRVSPGVYRNQQGGLVGSRGQQLPGARQQQPQRPPTASVQPGNNGMLNGIAAGIQGGLLGGAGKGQGNMNFMPYPSQPQSGMLWAGGSPNFNEMNGGYNNQYNPMAQPFYMGFPPGKQPGAWDMYQPQQPMNQQQYDTGFGDYMRQRAEMFRQQQQQASQQQPQQMQQPQVPPTGQGNI